MRLGILFCVMGMAAGVMCQGGVFAGEGGATLPAASGAASALASASGPAGTRAATPYYLVYVNKKDDADDDFVTIGGETTVSVELHDMPHKSDVTYFKLQQKETEGGKPVLKFLDADGAPVSEEHVYAIHGGEVVTVRALGLAEGKLEIMVSSVDAED